MIGKIVNATVSRIEPYGVYLDGPDDKKIIVLIPDVSAPPIQNLREFCTVGDQLSVRIVQHVEDRGLYKGTIKDVCDLEKTDSRTSNET